MLNNLSNYATRYRPELDLVLKDISVTVVRLVSARYTILANIETYRMQRKRSGFADGRAAGNLHSCSRYSASSRLAKAGSRLMESTFRRSDSETVSFTRTARSWWMLTSLSVGSAKCCFHCAAVTRFVRGYPSREHRSSGDIPRCGYLEGS
jgi:hypothetical protein